MTTTTPGRATTTTTLIPSVNTPPSPYSPVDATAEGFTPPALWAEPSLSSKVNGWLRVPQSPLFPLNLFHSKLSNLMSQLHRHWCLWESLMRHSSTLLALLPVSVVQPKDNFSFPFCTNGGKQTLLSVRDCLCNAGDATENLVLFYVTIFCSHPPWSVHLCICELW